MNLDKKIEECCRDLPAESLAEVLLFVRLWRCVPEFRKELHALAAPGVGIPPLDITEALMDKWSSKLPKEMVL